MQTSSFTVLILSLLLCLSKGVDGNLDPNIDSENNDTFVGGGLADNVPYQASLRDNTGRHLCGGAIISSRTILTAARCVQGENITSVVVGTNLLGSGGTSHDLKRTVIHPRYDNATKANDISLVITKKKILFNNKMVGSIPLPAENSILRNGTDMFATGWDLTDELSINYTNRLQGLITSKITLQHCRNYWDDIISKTNICVFGTFAQGVCTGDPGGPVAVNRTIYGISYGLPCAVGVPDVLTRVASFVPWITSSWVE